MGQSSIGIPGTLGVNIIERPAEVEGTFSTAAPLILHFGYTTPEANVNLYNTLINKLSEMLEVKMQQDKNCKYSGGIINTCGWVSVEEFKFDSKLIVFIFRSKRMAIKVFFTLPLLLKLM